MVLERKKVHPIIDKKGKVKKEKIITKNKDF